MVWGACLRDYTVVSYCPCRAWHVCGCTLIALRRPTHRAPHGLTHSDRWSTGAAGDAGSRPWWHRWWPCATPTCPLRSSRRCCCLRYGEHPSLHARAPHTQAAHPFASHSPGVVWRGSTQGVGTLFQTRYPVSTVHWPRSVSAATRDGLLQTLPDGSLTLHCDEVCAPLPLVFAASRSLCASHP